MQVRFPENIEVAFDLNRADVDIVMRRRTGEIVYVFPRDTWKRISGSNFKFIKTITAHYKFMDGDFISIALTPKPPASP